MCILNKILILFLIDNKGVNEDFVLPCQMETGEEGLCRPLVKCLSFYADVPELRKQPCQLGDQQAVCCPLKIPKKPGEYH